MHMGPVPGSFVGEEKSLHAEAPGCHCRSCGSTDIWYQTWESSDEAYTDVRYHCRGCGKIWWVEGPDA